MPVIQVPRIGGLFIIRRSSGYELWMRSTSPRNLEHRLYAQELGHMSGTQVIVKDGRLHPLNLSAVANASVFTVLEYQMLKLNGEVPDYENYDRFDCVKRDTDTEPWEY